MDKMKKLAFVLLAGILVVFAMSAGRSNYVADDVPRRAQILFLGHAGNQTHNPTKMAATLAIPLFQKGINITYTSDTTDLTAENLGKYDGVIIYANIKTLSPAKEKALKDFVESGKGFIPLHAASATFNNSAWYVGAVGGTFKRHERANAFKVTNVNTTHPVMEGVTEYTSFDEPYEHDNINPDKIVLQERIAPGGAHEPWTWVRNQGKGRVFYTAGGHNDSTWMQPSYQKLVANGILWAVGDNVSKQVTAFRPPVPRFNDTMIVPDYQRRKQAPKFQYAFTAEESMKLTEPLVDFEVKLFASEPDIVNPIAMSWDERGRLWVIESVDYPNTFLETDGASNDRIKICEDTNGDGKADKFTVFADKLNIPTSIVFVNGGVLVSQAPYFVFLKDTNGDDKADVRQNVLNGWYKNDTHFGPSNLQYGFDNRAWGVIGTSYAGTGKDGKTVAFRQGIYSLKSDGTDLRFLANQTNNNWGLGFTEDNHVFASTANGDHSDYYSMESSLVSKAISPKVIPEPQPQGQVGPGARCRGPATVLPLQNIQGHVDMHTLDPGLRQVDNYGGFTAAAGHHFYTARNYPKQYWNRIAFVCEPTGRLVHNAVIENNGAGFKEKDGWNLIASSDEWYGPVHAEVGPDGAVWIADWYNFIIQHNPTPGPAQSKGKQFITGQGNAYDTPMRDINHGRVYRVVYKKAKPYTPVVLNKTSAESLLAGLENDNMFWRMHAQRLLVETKNKAAIPGLYKLINNQKVDEIGLNSPAVHALWTLHGLGVLDGSNKEALQVATKALSHPAAGVRKAALEVLPRTQVTTDAIQKLGMINEADLNTRMNVFIALASLPSSMEVGKALYTASLDARNENDEWLSKSLFAAATKHDDGFIAAMPKDNLPALTPGTALNLSQRVYFGLISQTYTYPIGGRGFGPASTTTPDVAGKDIVIKGSVAKGTGGVAPLTPSLYRVATPPPPAGGPGAQAQPAPNLPLVPLNGFIFGQGTKDNGYALIIEDGKLKLTVYRDKKISSVTSASLPEKFDFVAKLSAKGEGSLEIDGKPSGVPVKLPSSFTSTLPLETRAGRDVTETYLRAGRKPTDKERLGTYADAYVFTGANTTVTLQVSKPGLTK